MHAPLRLAGYDYRQPGAYFVTVCTDWRRPMLGEIADSEMRPSNAGLIVQDVWNRLPQRFPSIVLDAFVVMPNHVHGIVFLGAVPERNENGAINLPSLSEIMRQFKAISTHRVRSVGISEFGWQRNFHEHIIRNDAALIKIREYIEGNPGRRAEDEENRNSL
jgi:REP element-mobilizing transposase RayT